MAITGFMLAVFTFMNFVLAMTASVFSGILDLVAVPLGVSVANAGLLNSMYAYGAGIGVPVVLILLRKISRSAMLKTMLLVTILMSLSLVIARNFALMLIIRLIMGISANSYSVLATAAVAALSPKEKLGRSMAILIAGNASALVIGVPLTRALSSVLDWQGVFWILIGMMVLALIYFALRLPGGERESSGPNMRGDFAFFRDGKVLLIVGFALVMFMGQGAFYTYITPYLLFFFPTIDALLPLILVLLGIASFTGNLIGGHVTDRIGYARSMLVGGLLQLAAVILMLVFRQVQWLAVSFAILWIMSVWFTGLQLVTGVTQATRNESSFMISMNNSAIQLGSALGSSVAAVVISLVGIQGILYVTLLTCVVIVSMQLVSMKKIYTAENIGMGE